MVRYSDSEVRVFHPICEKALNNAITNLGRSRTYQVIHHRYTGSLEMDFVIENKKTGKYLCVVEVKRTPGDVQSTRNQFQAQSYVQMNTVQNEKPFYIITNLETLISFRYDTSKPRVYQQMLQPGLEYICDFSTDNDSAIESKLTVAFERLISNFISGTYTYSTTLEQFLSYMDSTLSNDRMWKSSMAILMYEYIRGAFSAVRRTDIRYDVRKFHDDVQQICIEANRVDFDGIFQYDSTRFLPRHSVAASILSDIYTYGNTNISGDAVADALHSKLSENKHHDGEVATDSELALLAATLAKMSNGDLLPGRKICDPAAGSGNLICSAINVFNVSASALKANDINKKLIELLSLRLGLNFPTSINHASAPEVSAEDINNLPAGYFNDVDVVLLNPPFVAGINCVNRKPTFYNTIRNRKGSDAVTLVGQMNLGAVFLETVCWMVNPGTTVVCIFPKAHLKERGEEAVSFRRMLLHSFGLHTIFNYPAEDLFDAVIEETCIFVGKVRQPATRIKVYSSNDKVADLDLHALENYTGTINQIIYSTIIPGIEARSFSFNELDRAIDDGWRFVCSEMTESMDFVSHNILLNPKMTSIVNTTNVSRRGNVGGSGASDLVFFDSFDALYNRYLGMVPLSAGMRNAQHDVFELSSGDSEFIDFTAMTATMATNVINDYIPLQRAAEGQSRNTTKPPAEIKKIAERYARVVFQANSVLVPTKLRRTGRVHVTRVPMHISTNFAVFSYGTANEANIIGSYMSTIFYQLECEVQSKDHAGLRKLELQDVQTTHAPIVSALTTAEIARVNAELPNIHFLDLNNPVIRNIDLIWADILYGTNANAVLNDALRLLRFLANRRNP